MSLKDDINIYLHGLSVQVLFLPLVLGTQEPKLRFGTATLRVAANIRTRMLPEPRQQKLPLKNKIKEFFYMFIFCASVKIINAAEKKQSQRR